MICLRTWDYLRRTQQLATHRLVLWSNFDAINIPHSYPNSTAGAIPLSCAMRPWYTGVQSEVL